MSVRVDKTTLFNAAIGAILQARGHTLATATVVSVASELLSLWLYQMRPETFPNPNNETVAQMGMNVGASAAGWWVAKQLAPSTPSST